MGLVLLIFFVGVFAPIVSAIVLALATRLKTERRGFEVMPPAGKKEE